MPKDPDMLCQQSLDLAKKLSKEVGGSTSVSVSVWLFPDVDEKFGRVDVEWSAWLASKSQRIAGKSWDELMLRIEAELQSLKTQKAAEKLEE